MHPAPVRKYTQHNFNQSSVSKSVFDNSKTQHNFNTIGVAAAQALQTGQSSHAQQGRMVDGIHKVRSSNLQARPFENGDKQGSLVLSGR